jgi:hypothetical protein
VRTLIGVISACLGCGRVGFAVTDDGASGDAMVTGTDVAGTLACETDVVLGPVPKVGELLWFDGGSTQVIFAVQELDASHAELHAHRLAVTGGAITEASDTMMIALKGIVGLGVTATSSGYAAVFSDRADLTLHELQLDASFGIVTNTKLTGLAFELRPFARSSAGTLIVARDALDVIYAVPVDADLAMLGVTTQVDAGASDQPSIVALGADFVIPWSSLSNGPCHVVRANAAGAVVAGPLALASPATCLAPQVQAFGAGYVAYSIDDFGIALSTMAYAGVIDPSFATVSAPVAIGSGDSEVTAIVDGGGRALLAVRNTGASRIVQVLASGAASTVGSDFGLAGTDNDMETLAVVGGALVHVRTESGQLIVRKLCR